MIQVRGDLYACSADAITDFCNVREVVVEKLIIRSLSFVLFTGFSLNQAQKEVYS